MRRLLRDCYHAAYRNSLPFRFWIADRRDPGGQRLPPARLRYRVGETLDPHVFLNTGQSGAERLQAVLREAGLPMEGFQSVLDFGCGCGRTARWLQNSCSRFWGVDVDQASVAWCARNLPFGQFKVAGARPPLAFEDSSFDLIYAISVFTHLDHALQRAWRDELRRLLMPGGVLFFTIHAEHVGSRNGAEFQFQTSKKHRGVLPDWYHTTFQTPQSVLATFGERFPQIRRIPRGMGDQDVYLAFRSEG